MIDSYLITFAMALLVSAVVAAIYGDRAERETVFLLVCVWLGTVAINWATRSYTSAGMYAAIDAFALAFLLFWGRQNWQWITAALFTMMVMTHLVFFSLTEAGLAPLSPRPYQDFIALLGYLQMLTVGVVCYERVRPYGWFSFLGPWAFSDSHIFVRYVGYKNHAEP
jgi:hypothetical protein